MRAFIASLLIAPLLLLSGCTDDFKDSCDNQGGVVKEDSKVVTTTSFDSNGKMTTSNTIITTRFCVVDGVIVATD